MKFLLLFLLIIVLLLFSVTFGAHNDQLIKFNYLIAQGEYRLSALLAVVFCVGFFIGMSFCSLFWLRTRLLLARTRRKLKRLESQNTSFAHETKHKK